MATVTTLNLSPIGVRAPDGKVYDFDNEQQAQVFERSIVDAGGECSRASAPLEVVPAPQVAVIPAIPSTLYDLEEELAALLDTEAVVPLEQEEEFRTELQRTMLATIEKRDRVGQFMAHLESQAVFAKQEVERLTARRRFFERAFERMEAYVSKIIHEMGTDAKGKRKKLEGNTVTFALRGCDQSVEVTDEAAVPSKYKRLTITLPAELWEQLLDSVDLDLRAQVVEQTKRPAVEVMASLVKPDLKANIEVPGAKLAGGTYLKRS